MKNFQLYSSTKVVMVLKFLKQSIKLHLEHSYVNFLLIGI